MGLQPFGHLDDQHHRELDNLCRWRCHPAVDIGVNIPKRSQKSVNPQPFAAGGAAVMSSLAGSLVTKKMAGMSERNDFFTIFAQNWEKA